MSTLRSIVLCGGSGTRLWPLSRALYPKQFMDLGGHTLFGDTVDRAAALPDSADPLVVCNEEHRFYVAAALQQKGVSGTILLEPKGRNTAPAIALAAFAALSGGGEDGRMVCKPCAGVGNPCSAEGEVVSRSCVHEEGHREAELASGQCLTGAHKDDIEISVNGRSARSSPPQGQPRTAPLPIKLAEREIFLAEIREYPVLLLYVELAESDAEPQ